MTPPMEYIEDYTLAGLSRWLAAEGEKPFRAKQIFQWLYQHWARDFEEMTSVSRAMRAKLAGRFRLGPDRSSRCIDSGRCASS